jgi:hypothetical protein
MGEKYGMMVEFEACFLFLLLVNAVFDTIVEALGYSCACMESFWIHSRADRVGNAIRCGCC